MGVVVKAAKQTNRVHSLTEQIRKANDREETGRLTTAFLRLTAALPRGVTPSPAHWWYNVARGSNALPFKGRDAVRAGQSVMDAAISTGDQHIMEETAHLVVEFFDAMERAALRRYHEIAAGAITIEQAMLAASRETTQAAHAVSVYAINRDAESLNAAIREAIDALETLMELRAAMLGRTDADCRASHAGKPLRRMAALS